MINDEDFIARLLESREQFNRFALKQAEVGVEILTPPLKISPTHEDRYKHIDKADGLALIWVEHKVRNLEFTCRDDYPFKTVIVDEAYKIDGKQHPACIYVIQNRSLTHAAVVYGWTKCHWHVEEIFDRSAGRGGSYYTAGVDMVRFCKTEEVFVCQ